MEVVWGFGRLIMSYTVYVLGSFSVLSLLVAGTGVFCWVSMGIGTYNKGMGAGR